jgi:hypothetical protein
LEKAVIENSLNFNLLRRCSALLDFETGLKPAAVADK